MYRAAGGVTPPLAPTFDHGMLTGLRTDRIEPYLTHRNAWRVLLVVALLTMPALMVLRELRLDHDFEKFFPQNDPELERYEGFRARFGHEADFLLIGIERDRSVIDSAFLRQVEALCGELEQLPHTRSIASITRLKEIRLTPAGAFQIPWLRMEADSLLSADSARIWSNATIRSQFISDDARTLCLMLVAEPGLSKTRSDSLLMGIEREIRSSGLEGGGTSRVRIAGRLFAQHHYLELMQREMVLFLSISIVLLAGFLFIAFRKAWGVLIPIGVVGLTVLWQVALMTSLGKPLSILTMLLPSILFVVGMSDMVHLIERYLEALRSGLDKARALARTFHEVGLATFLTSLSTAIGFASLATSSIQPIREFGIYTAIGVMVAFVLAFSVLPAVLILVPTPLHARHGREVINWDPLLHRTYAWVLRHRRKIAGVTVLLCLLSVAGASRLKVNNYLLEDWPADDPHLLDFHFFEDHFGGVRPFELEIAITDTTRHIWDLEVLLEIERVQQYAEKEYGVNHILSPVSLIRAVNRASNGGSAEFDRLPDDDSTAALLWQRARSFAGGDELAALMSVDGRHARITGRSRDEGGAVHQEKNERLIAHIKAGDPAVPVRFDQTGMAYLIDHNNRTLSAQLLGSLGIAFVLIGLMMALVFRNWRMTIVAILPNVVPMLLIAGIMGVLGIDLKVSTSIIFTIAFGIAVDDSIHLLGKLRVELAKGRSLAYAMKRSFLSAGKAVVITSIMLCSGFIALVASDFASVYYMGLLVSITLAVALMADLFLLPILVMGLGGEEGKL